jgi:hypothetical protein
MATPRHRLARAFLILVALVVSGCGSPTAVDQAGSPAKVVRLPGTNLKEVVLSPVGAARIGIKTAPVQRAPGAAAGRGSAVLSVIPTAGVLYDAAGNAFTFTNPAPLRFVRYPIVIDHIAANRAYLRGGPPPGTLIVTVGDDELVGAIEGVQE